MNNEFNENLIFSLWVCYESWILFLVVVGCPIRPQLVVRCPNWFIDYYNFIPPLNLSITSFLFLKVLPNLFLSPRLLSTSTPISTLFLTVEAEAIHAFSTPPKSGRKQIHVSKILYQQASLFMLYLTYPKSKSSTVWSVRFVTERATILKNLRARKHRKLGLFHK